MGKHSGFRRLTSPIQFYTAKMDGTVILVFQESELIGSGKISELTEEVIKVRGEYYLRETCIFAYA